jgi:halogenation protein CepH
VTGRSNAGRREAGSTSRGDDPEDVGFRGVPEYFPRSYTYHVDRARFDALLLDNARAKGADVREGWTVSDVRMENGRAAGVIAARPGEAPRAIAASVVVDATGRDCLIARDGLAPPDPSLTRLHFTSSGGRRSASRTCRRRPDPGATTTDVHRRWRLALYIR